MIAREIGRDVTPHQMRLRKSVQQQHRRTRSEPACEDRGLAGFDCRGVETVHVHVRQRSSEERCSGFIHFWLSSTSSKFRARKTRWLGKKDVGESFSCHCRA
jgi:hypothetical protein